MAKASTTTKKKAATEKKPVGRKPDPNSKRAKARAASLAQGKKDQREAAARLMELLEVYSPMTRSRLMQRMTGYERDVRDGALASLAKSSKVIIEAQGTGRRGRPPEVITLA